MPSSSSPDAVVTGIGVTCAIGQGKSDFTAALLRGHTNFTVMRRPGRQYKLHASAQSDATSGSSSFLGAEIGDFALPESFPGSKLRNTSLSSQIGIATLDEAWNEAGLQTVHPDRIGLVVGGSNFQQRELTLIHDAHRNREQFLRPSYGMSFMDSDLCGVCTEHFGIRGFAYTLGGASASGQLAVIHANQAVLSGQVDVCIALGALMDLSYWECQGFRSMGAMGSDRYADAPALACRPFDRHHDGFIFGEACGAIVIERAVTSSKRNVPHYARISGWATEMDRNRNPNPSFDGEVSVIQCALERADLSACHIDYINPHGTGSTVGDETEIAAIRHCGLTQAHINATKSITGHGLSAAGTVEIIASLLQMKAGQLHPTRNLDDPIDPGLLWVRGEAISHRIRNALNLSFGFGGTNSAICLRQA